MMRYRFIDQVVFEPGDDALSGPTGADRVPCSLLLELMAMTGGRELLRRYGGERIPLLLKVRECRFDGVARAGVPLRATARVHGVAPVSERVSIAEADATAFAGEAEVAAGTLVYVCAAVEGLESAVQGLAPALQAPESTVETLGAEAQEPGR